MFLFCLVFAMSLSFPIGILGQVWFLIVPIPDLCTFTYFHAYMSTISVLNCLFPQ